MAYTLLTHSPVSPHTTLHTNNSSNNNKCHTFTSVPVFRPCGGLEREREGEEEDPKLFFWEARSKSCLYLQSYCKQLLLAWLQMLQSFLLVLLKALSPCLFNECYVLITAFSIGLLIVPHGRIAITRNPHTNREPSKVEVVDGRNSLPIINVSLQFNAFCIC